MLWLVGLLALAGGLHGCDDSGSNSGGGGSNSSASQSPSVSSSSSSSNSSSSSGSEYPICVTVTGPATEDYWSESCVNNPDFSAWSGLTPDTCLNIAACNYQSQYGTSFIPNYVSMSVLAGPTSVLKAKILNCNGIQDPVICTLSNDAPDVPLSHSVIWNQIGGADQTYGLGPRANLYLLQIGTSNANTLPVQEYPGVYILIYDQYGNAALVNFEVTYSACGGDCP